MGLRVPALLADDHALGAALVEDLGDRDLSAELLAAPSAEKARLLDEAENLLVDLRRLPRAAVRNAPFDAAFFEKELDHTRLWAFEKGGEAPLPDSRRALWDRLAGVLARTAADPAAVGDLVPTHRDFHANNLVRASDGRLALLDFQDLRLGPPDYDPVSLRFERAGARVASDAGSYVEAVLLQRAWKVLGTFEKMLSRGRVAYRPHRDVTWSVLRRHTSADGPFAPLLSFLPAEARG